MTEKNLSLEEWLDQGSRLMQKRHIHYVHKTKGGTTNWFFENGEVFSPSSLLQRNRKSSRFAPNLGTSPSRSKNVDEFNFLYSKMTGVEIDTLDDIVKNRKSSKCKCNKRYPIVDLVDRESGDHAFICSNCKGTIISRKLKGKR